MSNITVFTAREIITMNPSQPEAHAIAVRDGRILAVGSLEDAAAWGDYQLNTQFADQVIMPGLVEGHSHVMQGTLWHFPYLGYFDRTGPDGKLWSGLASIDAVVDALCVFEQQMTNPNEPLFAWGFDPIYFGGTRMVLEHLDRVSSTRPIMILHSNGHLANTNRVLLERAGIDKDTQVEGILKDSHGKPTGELQEFAALYFGYAIAGDAYHLASEAPSSLWNFAYSAQLAGVTTATDLYNEVSDATLTTFQQVSSESNFPIRLVSALTGTGIDPQQGIEKLHKLTPLSQENLKFGIVKLFADGSIQGLTGRLRWPGYYNGAENGIWVTAPEQLEEQILAYHQAGFQLHIHTNGDEAIQVALDALEKTLQLHPRPNHRHTLQHCQMPDRAQLKRMATLGLCANMFSNHLYYWGDVHYQQTMGPDRSCRMDPVASAIREGVAVAIHSDAPVTPIGPLFTAWCAVNRQTASGRILGSSECISVAQALHAITLGAAYTLHMDQDIGSIEVGKWADFTVLADNPLTTDPSKLKDIPILNTVLGGKVTQTKDL